MEAITKSVRRQSVQTPYLRMVMDGAGDGTAQVQVEQHGNGAQTIRVSTHLQGGRLLLHWGVEGGKDYKGGWRLPGQACRPPGTSQYKDRALQSPFTCVRSHLAFPTPPHRHAAAPPSPLFAPRPRQSMQAQGQHGRAGD